MALAFGVWIGEWEKAREVRSGCHLSSLDRRARSDEGWVPAMEGVGEVVVQDAGADLEQQVSPSGCPAHLLLFDHPLADNLVDGGLDEGTGNGLTRSIAFAVVRDPRSVGSDVAAKLTDRLAQLALFGARVLVVDVELNVVDRLQRKKDVAVPEIPLESVQFLGEFGGELGILA